MPARVCLGAEKRVVAIVHSGEESLAGRLKSEMSLLGFVPELVSKSRPVEADELKAIARALDADAVVRIAPGGGSIGVWIAAVDNEVVVLQEVYAPDGSEQSQAIIAFKAQELLRAGMVLGEAEAPPAACPEVPPCPDEPSPPAEPECPASPRSRTRAPERLALAVTPAVSYGFSELPPAFQLGLALQFMLNPRLFVNLSGLVPVVSPVADIPEGRVHFSLGMVTLGFGVRLTPPNWRLSVPLEAFVGVALVNTNGYTGSVEGSTEGDAQVAVFGGRTGFAVALSDSVSIRGDIVVGGTQPVITPTVEGQTWTEWGVPFLVGMVGIEAWLF